MDNSKIKKYAPQARTDFRKAVASRLALFGITNEGGELHIEQLQRDGTSIVIGGRAYPRSVGEKRERLEHVVKKDGYEQTVERLAYTWFNRLVAIRYMELHGYLDHGYRVLSHPEGKPLPEILEHAEHVDLPGLSKSKVVELKIDGNKDEELYRLLLVAQCNALHSAMPFLFERADDETELVLPDNLLNTDSVIRKLVAGIDENAWQEVEVIGWLYEAYISERYEAVIGKVVASEDIPAATQRFTPKWIVRYLVQNTLGRTWLATYPNSPLRQQMEYYIEPAEQTPEVQAQLKAITPASLNPEEITFLDPACGSGHILVEAYDLYRAIYQERGYRAREIPSFILQKNLFGLEIDDRAAQLASFALLMKARADDSSLFRDERVQPNIVAIQDSKGFDAREIAEHLNQPVLLDDPPATGKLFDDPGTLFTRERMAVPGSVAEKDIAAIIALFGDAKTFGSLIQVPKSLSAMLASIEHRSAIVAERGEGFALRHSANFLPLVKQARLLARQFNCVVANPPYMGGKYYSSSLKALILESFPRAKADICTCFVERALSMAVENGHTGLITMQSWMFLSSFEAFRVSLLGQETLLSMAHLGANAFPNIPGQVVQVTMFTASPTQFPAYRSSFKRLLDGDSRDKSRRFQDATTFLASADELHQIPGSPIAYWVSPKVRSIFRKSRPLRSYAPTKQGLATTNNDLFLRGWHEVSVAKLSLDSTSEDAAESCRKKWFPCNKGGGFRRWYGNNYHVVNYENRGKTICDYIDETPGVKVKSNGRVINRQYYFRSGLTWSSLSTSALAMRFCPSGYVFETKGSMCFPDDPADLMPVLAFCNSKLLDVFLGALSPTLDYHEGPLGTVPYIRPTSTDVSVTASQLVQLGKADWDAFETSWNFEGLSFVLEGEATLELSVARARSTCESRFFRAKDYEERINALFIDTYELSDELSPKVSDDQITLYRPDRTEDIRRLISYAIGCMMGRYSLDKAGLIYAHAGNIDFDSAQYIKFRADDDGILPLTETDWGLPDDVAKRFEEFVSVAWPKETLEENLIFVAESLDQKKGETARETIRRYLATGFYKHHLQMYKRRPIYWMFSSGKLRAFQCLVYLHRYNEGTLARMRTEYVIPLQGRIGGRIQQLEEDLAKPSTTAQGKKIKKELDDLRKEEKELRAFDERLKHYADKRIVLDLDDGVKVNYGKFGDLLADVKAVTGGKDEE